MPQNIFKFVKITFLILTILLLGMSGTVLSETLSENSIQTINTQNNNIEKKNSTITLSTERQQELIYIVQQDCGSCHGMTLKGGLGPSLLPERISILPKHYLIDVITHGRPGTPMPPWSNIFNTDEIQWLAEQLLLGKLGQKR